MSIKQGASSASTSHDAIDKCASNLMTWEYGRHRPDSRPFVSYMIHFRFSMALSLRVTVILKYLKYRLKHAKVRKSYSTRMSEILLLGESFFVVCTSYERALMNNLEMDIVATSHYATYIWYTAFWTWKLQALHTSHYFH